MTDFEIYAIPDPDEPGKVVKHDDLAFPETQERWEKWVTGEESESQTNNSSSSPNNTTNQ